jgi:hypothetical protein
MKKFPILKNNIKTKIYETYPKIKEELLNTLQNVKIIRY